MSPQIANKNAIAAIRVSTTKQGTDGDSPEAQKEQIERFAASRGITIKQFFVFMESASKDQQPVQPAIDYCKDSKNDIQLFIVKSIDRFTRGGSDLYGPLKMQLDQCKVRLVDIYGVISAEEVNTLDHLGFEYKWSKYSPSKKSEILEAERAKDELRDIMSRMIGAEIRFTQLGYWMRQPPYGFVSEKIDTKHGKRCILRPHPTESKYMIMIYDLRVKRVHDKEIVEKVNELGFRTRVRYKRDKNDRSKVISKSGGQPLTVKAMHKLIRNPIYAGINAEKWTDGKPVKCAFKGLVSVDTFNRANKGKVFIAEKDSGEVMICTKRPPKHLVDKGRRNPDFPYRKFILCPECGNPLSGSASRGRNGKRYPAYHCSNYGHYYRIPKQELEDTVAAFVRNLIVPSDKIQAVLDAVAVEWNLRNQSKLEEIQGITDRIEELRKDAVATMDKIRVLSSPTAIKFMEEDLLRIEKQIDELAAEKAKKEAAQPADLKRVLGRARHLAENLEELLIKQIDPIKKGRLFALLFDQTPAYNDLQLGSSKTPLFTGVNAFFQLLKDDKSLVVTSRGIEPRLPG
jgi:site-specific DNA recombinase